MSHNSQPDRGGGRDFLKLYWRLSEPNHLEEGGEAMEK